MTLSPRQLIPVLLTTTLLAGLCGALIFVTDSESARPKTTTLRIFEKARSIQMTKADGRVLKKLPLAEPEPGDRIDIVFDIFSGDHRKHARKPQGSDHLRCQFGSAGPPECVSHAAFGSSMLVVEGNPGRVVLGTGKYLGASGRVISSKETKAAPPSSLRHNDIDVVARITRR